MSFVLMCLFHFNHSPFLFSSLAIMLLIWGRANSGAYISSLEASVFVMGGEVPCCCLTNRGWLGPLRSL